MLWVNAKEKAAIKVKGRCLPHLTIEIFDILRCRHRRYPVDHRIRKADLALDPPRKLRILLAGEAKHHPPRHLSIVLNVVTGLDGKSWKPIVSPHFKRRAQVSNTMLGAQRVLQIVLRTGVIKIKFPEEGLTLYPPFVMVRDTILESGLAILLITAPGTSHPIMKSTRDPITLCSTFPPGCLTIKV